jgi:hypothetical protein
MNNFPKWLEEIRMLKNQIDMIDRYDSAAATGDPGSDQSWASRVHASLIGFREATASVVLTNSIEPAYT